MRSIRVFGSIIGLLVFSGCASIVSGAKQQVSFDTNPTGADVYVDGNKVCTTPCVANIPRAKMLPRVEIKKDGFANANVPLMSRFNYWVIGNVLWGYSSTTGFAVDLLSNDGASTVEYDPNRYFTTMEPIRRGSKEEGRSQLLRFVVANHDELVVDISRGTGEYLSALYDLIGVEKDKEATALSKLKDLSARYGDTVEFARAVGMTL